MGGDPGAKTNPGSPGHLDLAEVVVPVVLVLMDLTSAQTGQLLVMVSGTPNSIFQEPRVRLGRWWNGGVKSVAVYGSPGPAGGFYVGGGGGGAM